MRLSHRRGVYSINRPRLVVLVLTTVSSTIIPSAWAQDPEPAASKFADIARHALVEELAELSWEQLTPEKQGEMVSRYGEQGVTSLAQTLTNNQYPPRLQARACDLLGRVKSPAGRDAMIALLRQSPPAVLKREHMERYSHATAALGSIGDEAALQFLAVLSGHSFWEEQPVKPVAQPDDIAPFNAERTKIFFRDEAMQALALSRKPEALELLHQLLHGEAADQPQLIERAILNYQMVTDPEIEREFVERVKQDVAFWKKDHEFRRRIGLE